MWDEDGDQINDSELVKRKTLLLEHVRKWRISAQKRVFRHFFRECPREIAAHTFFLRHFHHIRQI